MVTVSSGAPLTWDSAAFAWTDANAGKTWLASHTTAYTLAPTEPLSLLPLVRCAPQTSQTETTALRSLLSHHTAHTAAAAIRTHDAYTSKTAYERTCERTLTADSTAAHTIRKQKRDALTLGETTKRTAVHTADTHLSASEASSADLLHLIAGTLSILPLDKRSIHKQKRDALALAETTERTAQHRSQETLTAAETLAPHTAYRRTLDETVTADLATARQTAHTARSAVRLADAYLTPWQGILSNITLLTGGLSDEAWKSASASPSGYESFHPFEVGEYTYRDALIRLLLTTGAAGADPLLYDVRFHVDIEDTRESGTAECSADAPTRITLTRRFYLPPRIVLTVLGSAESDLIIPRLIGQDETDGVRTFDCELRRTDGTRTSGTVSWMAEGY